MSARRSVVSIFAVPAALLAALAGVPGCALWSDVPAANTQLPAPSLAADSVILEVAFVHLPAGNEERAEALWTVIDEQQLATELRRRLLDNGFRCGIIASQLPDDLRGLLDETEKQQALDSDSLEVAEGDPAPQQRMQIRSGRRGSIAASRLHEKMVVLSNDDGRVVGQTYPQAQCLFGVRTFPQGDGRVRIELTPEVHHGQARPRWIGGEGRFRLETGRERVVQDELRMAAVLSPGYTLLITGTDEPKGLGQHFFSRETPVGGEQTLLLIRLAQTQFDDLFGGDELQTPLATPAE